MGEQLFELLRHFFAHWGYWALFCTLLLENAGIPVPGETVLLFASFLAYSEKSLHLGYIILFGILACTVGDNIGYWVGHLGGRPLLDRYQHIFHIRDKTLRRGERLFERYGAVTIFFARFIFGMRIIAGPMAGVLRMDWKRFLLFNLLGASLWVSVIVGLGYLFASEWERLLAVLHRVNLVVAIAAALVIFALWRRYRQAHRQVDADDDSPTETGSR